MIVVLPHPSALPRIKASTSRNRAEVNVIVPIQSIRLPSGLRDSGTRATVIAAAMIPIGTLMRKIHGHPRPSVSAPPTSGPIATAAPSVAPQMPNAVPRSRPWNSWASRASEVENMIAPPIPCPPRAMIRNSAVGATAQSREVRANRHSPIANTSRRPSRSASAPVVSSSAASVSA